MPWDPAHSAPKDRGDDHGQNVDSYGDSQSHEAAVAVKLPCLALTRGPLSVDGQMLPHGTSPSGGQTFTLALLVKVGGKVCWQDITIKNRIDSSPRHHDRRPILSP